MKFGSQVNLEGMIERDVKKLMWWDNPHNLYISILYEFGLPGLFIFCGYNRQIFMRYKNSVKNLNTIGLMGFVIAFFGISLGHFPIFLARCAAFIIPMFALLEVSTE